jgi:pilus assembly protein Flp/PilA
VAAAVWFDEIGSARSYMELGENSMRSFVINALIRLHQDDKGQGLVEYLLILALVAFAATAGMGSLASGLNSAFSTIGSILGGYIK